MVATANVMTEILPLGTLCWL